MPRRNQDSKTGRAALLGAGLLLTAVTVAAAHDMFLKPTRYFAPENSEVRVRVLNGTFTRSENSIAHNRLADASVVTDLSADDFNLYLKEDGIPDILEARQQAGEIGKPARERYHKHVKALVQVGTTPSDHYATALGYPAEIVPMENPYALANGSSLRVKTLVDGKPAANQYVLYGGTTANETNIEPRSVRSNAEGVATIPLSSPGTWYIKFINMARVLRDSVDYESKWATLTFQVR